MLDLFQYLQDDRGNDRIFHINPSDAARRFPTKGSGSDSIIRKWQSSSPTQELQLALL
ncbi:hypothetical protein B0O99DRAFT_625028, partial [Bisporella sp. PMI_857]